jgi:hypothetical protein
MFVFQGHKVNPDVVDIVDDLVEGDRIETLLLHKLNHSVDVLIDDELEI